MSDQVSASTPPEFVERPRLTPEQVEALKAMARERAIQATMEQRDQAQQPPMASLRPPMAAPQPQVVYVRRNFTVAELLLLLAISCGIVTGVQAIWKYGASILPQVEIRVK
jgi:hypothetical protein